MSSFEPVASVDDLTDPGTLMVEVQDQIVMLVKVNGQVFCIDDVCTHDGGSFDGGELCDHEITCPRHGAKFDVRTGQPVTMPATEPTIIHEVRVANGGIFVRLCEDESDPAALKSAQCAPAELQGKTAAPSEAKSSEVQQSSETPSTEPQSSEMPVLAEAVPSPAGSASSDAAAVSATDLPPGELNEDRCREELKKVIDPELFVNIVDLGLIYTVTISETEGENQHHVGIDMTMTSPMCPAGPQLIAQSKQVLMQLDTVADVEVKVVMDPPWTPDKMTDDARDQLGIF